MTALEKLILEVENDMAIYLDDIHISKSYIAKHYNQSSLAFRLLHSYAGSVHMAVSSDNSFKKSDFYTQTKKIEFQLQEFQEAGYTDLKVLEIGCGKGFNLIYLANKFPQIAFTGIDISGHHIKEANQKCRRLANIDIIEMDFDFMSFEPNSFDLIYEIESICYTKDHYQLAKNLFELLKVNGRWHIFELFRNQSPKSLPSAEKKLMLYLEKSIGLYEGKSFKDWQADMDAIGYRQLYTEDLSLKTLPNLIRFKRMAQVYFSCFSYIPFAKKWFPESLMLNALSSRLLYESVIREKHRYQEVIMSK